MITVILPISRKDYLRPVFSCLAELEKPDDTELLIILDGSQELQLAVNKKLNNLKGFSSIRVILFGDGPVENRNDRRYRIAAIHNMAKHHVPDGCDYVFLIEDDTVYPKGALMRFLSIIHNEADWRSLDTGYVGGLEIGRWKTKYIGAWEADDIDDPLKITSLKELPRENFIQQVEAGGFYCALTYASFYKEHNFEPYDKQGTNGLGCDVNYGLYLRRKGYQVEVTDVLCDHIGKEGAVNFGNTKPVQVEFYKHKNKWNSRVVV